MKKKEHCWGGKVHSENTPIQLRTKKSQYQPEEQKPSNTSKDAIRECKRITRHNGSRVLSCVRPVVIPVCRVVREHTDWAGDLTEVLLVVKNSSRQNIVKLHTCARISTCCNSQVLSVLSFSPDPIRPVPCVRVCLCSVACSQDKRI